MNASGRRDVSEFMGVKQQQVGGEPGNVLREQRDLEQQLRLGFAARQLHSRDRLLGDAEAETLARCFAADVQIRRAESRGGPQWIFADAPLCQFKALCIVAQFSGKSLGP